MDAERFDSVVTRAVALFQPTGLAVAVVQDGQLRYLAARGEVQRRSQQAVSPATPFAIASMTKEFTGTALALLVQDGTLRWDDPVVRHLPAFAMADPYVTAHMTVRDLLVHRSGLALGAGDLLTWPDSRWTPEDILRALPYLPLDHGFRERFVYDNTLYIVAGEIIRAVSGLSWATFVQQRLLAPLGMRDCAPAPDGRAAAQQHAGGFGNARPLTVTVWHPDPAGSIVCSAADLARWGQLHASLGRLPGGDRLLDEAVLREVHSPVTMMRPSGLDRRLGGTHVQGYALGWMAADFHGHLALWHGGTAPGGTTEMIVLPERRAAIVVLVNDQTPVAMPLARQLADVIVRGAQAADWLGDVAARMKPATVASSAKIGVIPAAAPPMRSAAPTSGASRTAPLAVHAGRFHDRWYGDITVTVAGPDSLELHLTRSALLRGPLIPLGGGQFLARWPDRTLNADAIVTFEYGPDGVPVAITMKAASSDTDFSYDFHHLRAVRRRPG
ncbi:MAG: serine hydrolase [Gemmatimonadaceae bacterium]|jgi:CubicO group peptidase (beta-lactamase class C family)|nr:serine hydrolase [Gemmatimonadaceae bacterium]